LFFLIFYLISIDFAFSQTITPNFAEKLDAITVEAERPDWESILSPGTVDVVIPEDFAGEQKDLPEFLETIPGLHINRRGGDGQYSTLSIRGSTAAQVNIYIDGVLQNFSGDAVVDLSLIPVHNVDRIEVYRGYVPVRFSGAPIGGVVNIVTKKPEGLSGKASVGVRDLGGREGDVTLSAPIFGGTILSGVHYEEFEGNFKYDYVPDPFDVNSDTLDFYTGRRIPAARRRQSNGHDSTDALLKWQNENFFVKLAWKKSNRYYPNATNGNHSDFVYSTKYIDIGLSDQDMNTYIDPTDPKFTEKLNQITPHRRQVVEQIDFQLGYRRIFKNLDLGIEINHTEQDKEYSLVDLPRFLRENINALSGVGLYWSKYNNERSGIVLDSSYKLGERNLIEARLDFSFEEQSLDANKSRSLEGGGFTEPPIIYLNPNPPAFLMLDHYNRTQWRFQLSDTITLGEDKDLWLTLVGRYDSVQDNVDKIAEYAIVKNEPAVTWNIALKKNMGEMFTFRMTGGTYVRYPTFYELYGDGVFVKPIDTRIVKSREYVRPRMEKGNQFDIGLDFQSILFTANTKFSLTYFHRLTTDFITPGFDQAGNMFYNNAGDTESSGVEFEANVSWPIFYLHGSVTWLDARYRNANSERQGIGGVGMSNIRLMLQPEWEWNLRGEFHLFDRSLSVFAENHFTGKMNEDRGLITWNGRSQRTALSVTNLGARYVSPWGFTLTAGVNDVFDQRPNQRFSGTRHLGGNNFEQIEFGLPYPLPGRSWYSTLEYNF
jgi:outer membrane receptor protein involved in Fe transport